MSNRWADLKNPGPLLAAAGLVFWLSACAVKPVPTPDPPVHFDTLLRLDATTFRKLPGWISDNHVEALAAFRKSCKKLTALPPTLNLGPAPKPTRAGEWRVVCNAAARVNIASKTEVQYFFESRFTPYHATNNAQPTGLFTGYYEPELRGAWKPDATYRYPIYARPKDLISINLGSFRPEWKGQTVAGRLHNNKLTPYPTRADINDGALRGKQLELMWVASAIDAFFLHIQGSGRVVFKDGSSVRIGFAGRNGQRYTPIGRVLVARNILKPEQVSLQTIRAWLVANPLAGRDLMEKNKAYIFFRIIEGEGPVGAQGVPLTAGRSLAVDRRYIPLGVPVWLVTTEPGKAKKPLRRLVVAQDTGSAIKGPVRGDLFVGFGSTAGAIAGRMKQPGEYYLLLPKK
ncbi:MAG: murein transglycosylase A [Alphaproteobacteria bacterium]|nr:murein transglycosylase A [Alphaproteobacteria bacterium]MBT7944058.1 murein transglycosylase A [Alphaproteobacteria bacterium]